MIFNITQSIILTLLIITVAFTIYYYFKKINLKLIQKDNGRHIIFTYITFIIIFLILIYLLFWVWNTSLFTMIGIDWTIVLDFLTERVGALISSVLIFIVGFGLIRLLSFILEYSHKSGSSKNTKRRKTILKLTGSILDYTLKIVLLLVILSIWGVNVLPAIAGFGILGLVIGFGAQDLMKDFIAGFFIIFEKHFDVGDIIEINGFKGEVIDIGLKTTKVMNWKKDVKLFNNASVQNAINYSFTESIAIVEVGISYDEDIENVMNILNNHLEHIGNNNADIIDSPECIGVINFSASSIDLRIVTKTKTEKQYAIERLIRKEIKRIFDENNIDIPYSQIVLHNAKDTTN